MINDTVGLKHRVEEVRTFVDKAIDELDNADEDFIDSNEEQDEIALDMRRVRAGLLHASGKLEILWLRLEILR